ncbi:MAG: hypothetical protein ABII00_05540 [Elusimicrobiota bacterium]
MAALGDFTYGTKLIGVGVGALILLFLISHTIRIVAISARALWSSIRRFWITAFPAEIPGADTDDQSEQLEQDISKVLREITQAASSAYSEATEGARSEAQRLSLTLLEECRLSAARIRSSFQKEKPSILIESLEAEARKIGHLLLNAASEHHLAAARVPPGRAAMESMRSILQRLTHGSPTGYRVRQIKEQLSFEPGDTLLVTAFKLQRRVALFLTGLVGKARAQGRVRQVPFRSILTEVLLKDLIEELGPPAKTFDQQYENLATHMQETAKIARFNLHSAGALLENDGDSDELARKEALQLALDGLDRTGARLERLPKEADIFCGALMESVTSVVERAGRRIRNDCDVADTFGERVAAAAESLLSSWRLFEERGQRRLRSTRTWAEVLRTRWSKLFVRVQEGLGIIKPQIGPSQATLEEATVEFAIKDTPPLYQRLFRSEPLTDEDFLTGREPFMPAVRTIRQRLDADLSAAMAVTGPVGTGKTSFLRCALQRYFSDKEPIWTQPDSHLRSESDFVDFISKAVELPGGDRPRDVQTLASAIRGLPDKPVIIIEGGSMLHLRRVGGFGAMRALFSLLSGTEGKSCWVITFSQTGWEYLDQTFGINRRFDATITLRGLSRTELEAAIMARHEVSGYDLEFTAGPGLSTDIRWKLRKVKDPERRQTILREEFFDTLHATDDRNLHAALYHWLRSTRSVGRRQVRVAPLAPFRKETLGELTLGELFGMLYALEHDHLTPSLYSQMLRSTLTESRTLLDYLAHRQIFSVRRKEGSESRYSPNPILLGPVLEALRDRNFIHD